MHLNAVTILHDRFPTRDHYPFNLDVMQQTETIPFTTPVTCLIGENGTGKSTLLRAIAIKCGIYIWGDTWSPRVTPNQYERRMPEAISVSWHDGSVPGSFFDPQNFKSYTKLIDEWAVADPATLSHYGGSSLVTKSHGQSLMAYFTNRYRKRGIYFLDEPETALSPKTQVSLLKLMTDMSKGGHAQFIVATHSPILMACPDATIWSFDESPVSHVAYEDTEHFRVYRDFMTNRERFVG